MILDVASCYGLWMVWAKLFSGVTPGLDRSLFSYEDIDPVSLDLMELHKE